MLGILLVDKQAGGTSHDVVDELRRKLQIRRIGHAGTLDPLATGLLIVAVGPATRFLQYLPLEPKEYVAEIHFGQATSTYDAEGEVTSEAPVPANLAEAVATTLPDMLGLIKQLPPMYSAVKLNGQPLYKYARAGKEVERVPRQVHIERFEILSSSPSGLKARIVCSGGTYIRTLAHDLGQRIGCGAYLSGLVRTGVGRFRLEDAKRIADISEADLIPLSDALPPMPFWRLETQQAGLVRDGRPIAIPPEADPDERLVGLLDSKGLVLGIGRVEGNVLKPECVLPTEAVYGS